MKRFLQQPNLSKPIICLLVVVYYFELANAFYISTTSFPCGNFEFQCNFGPKRCIPASLKCDGKFDCDDGSDEQHCREPVNVVQFVQMTTTPFPCNPFEFQCTFFFFKSCLPNHLKCDGKIDCGDGSDEQHCNATKQCGSHQFQCQTGSRNCLSLSYKCDGKYDCYDRSDETNCSTTVKPCSSDQFQCISGKKNCVPLSYKCDYDFDCDDFSDESNCSAAARTTPSYINNALPTYKILGNYGGLPNLESESNLDWLNSDSGRNEDWHNSNSGRNEDAISHTDTTGGGVSGRVIAYGGAGGVGGIGGISFCCFCVIRRRNKQAVVPIRM